MNLLNMVCMAIALLVTTAAQAQTTPAPSAAEKAAASRTEKANKAKQTATGVKAAAAALSPDELAIAERVYVGKLPCELGAFVTLTPDAKSPGYFDVQTKNQKFHMFPVATTTGAIRLEDHKAGVVWLQLANKSMMMNQKLGQRLADACLSPAQAAVDAALKLAPGRSVLDAPEPAAATNPAAAASTTK